MDMVYELWAYCPGEVAACAAIAALCGMGLALCVIGLLAPARKTEDEFVEEAC